jgi:hypothetical protein
MHTFDTTASLIRISSAVRLFARLAKCGGSVDCSEFMSICVCVRMCAYECVGVRVSMCVSVHACVCMRVCVHECGCGSALLSDRVRESTACVSARGCTWGSREEGDGGEWVLHTCILCLCASCVFVCVCASVYVCMRVCI